MVVSKKLNTLVIGRLKFHSNMFYTFASIKLTTMTAAEILIFYLMASLCISVAIINIEADANYKKEKETETKTKE